MPAASAGDDPVIVRRPQRGEPFTVVPKTITENARLSWASRAVLVYLLGLPDRWSPNVNHVAAQGPGGRDQMRRCFQELETAGYLVRHRDRDQHGRWFWTIDVYDHPVEARTSRAKTGVGSQANTQPRLDLDTDLRLGDPSIDGFSGNGPPGPGNPRGNKEPRANTDPPSGGSARVTGVDDAAEVPLSQIRATNGDWSLVLFRQGLAWLAKVHDKTPDSMRSLLGKALKLAGGDHQRVFQLLAIAQRDAVAHPQEWLIAQLGGKRDERRRQNGFEAARRAAFDEISRTDNSVARGGGDCGQRPDDVSD